MLEKLALDYFAKAFLKNNERSGTIYPASSFLPHVIFY